MKQLNITKLLEFISTKEEFQEITKSLKSAIELRESIDRKHDKSKFQQDYNKQVAPLLDQAKRANKIIDQVNKKLVSLNQEHAKRPEYLVQEKERDQVTKLYDKVYTKANLDKLKPYVESQLESINSLYSFVNEMEAVLNDKESKHKETSSKSLRNVNKATDKQANANKLN